MRAIRGAITAEKNSVEEIISSTKYLLEEIIKKNNLNKEEIISIIFTATEDLNKEYPAVAARKMGLNYIPLFCCQELKIKGSIKKCIRVLVHINRDCPHKDINHIYLRETKSLRPDLIN